MKNTQFSAKCRYCIPIHQGAPRYEKYTIFSRSWYCIMIHQGALSRAALRVSKAFLFHTPLVFGAPAPYLPVGISGCRSPSGN